MWRAYGFQDYHYFVNFLKFLLLSGFLQLLFTQCAPRTCIMISVDLYSSRKLVSCIRLLRHKLCLCLRSSVCMESKWTYRFHFQGTRINPSFLEYSQPRASRQTFTLVDCVPWHLLGDIPGSIIPVNRMDVFTLVVWCSFQWKYWATYCSFWLCYRLIFLS